MTKLQLLLGIIIIFTQVLLWSSYYYVLRNKSFSQFWGNIPKNEHCHLLLCATIAYILHIALLIYIVFNKTLTENHIYIAIYCVLFYYGLQLYFLPFVELLPKLYTRILLFIAVIPIAIKAYIMNQHLDNVKSTLEKIFIYASSLFPLYHVLVNDAINYGLNF